jgi:diguanylate cyclase (GGDEF)-like protein
MQGFKSDHPNHKRSFSDLVCSFVSLSFVLRKSHLSKEDEQEVKAALLRKTISSLLPVSIVLVALGIFYFALDCSEGMLTSSAFTSPGLALAGEALLVFPSLLLMAYDLFSGYEKKRFQKLNRAVLLAYYLCILGAALIFTYKDFLYIAQTDDSIYTFSVFLFVIFAFFPDFFWPEDFLLAGLEMGCPPLFVFLSGASWIGFYQIVIISFSCVLGSFFIKTKNVENEIHLLENRKTKEVLEEMSSIDQLTKAFNRYALVKDYSRIAHPLGLDPSSALNLYMIDIDEFKEYNDAFSHVQGDVCLAMISRCLINILSEKGLRLYRYGGEEFIAMYVAGESEALELGTTMREAVKALKIENPPAVTARKYLTISIGIASKKIGECPCLEKFVAAIDEQLYKSKESGRDAVFFDNRKITLA